MIDAATVADPVGLDAALLTLVACPDLCSRRWIWDQYDSMVGGQTAKRPGAADAAVVRIEDHTRALAMTTDCTPRYCLADPEAGGAQAVAEAWRNITAVGALPLAVTDNMNFGNPEKPEIMGQFAAAVRGMGAACRALDFPVVSGNVSLYNETEGRGILPTPAIGGVGVLDDVAQAVGLALPPGLDLVLVGETAGWLGQSLWLREIAGREDGAPPPVDLAAERRNGDFVRGRPGQSPPATTARMAGCWSRSPRWPWPAAAARRCCPAPRPSRRMPSGSVRTRPATSSPPPMAPHCWPPPPRPELPPRRSAAAGGRPGFCPAAGPYRWRGWPRRMSVPCRP